MLDAVGMSEINQIFAVTDAMGIHRESLVIPLGTGKGRSVDPRRQIEIIVDAEAPFEEWLGGQPEMIRPPRPGVIPAAGRVLDLRSWPVFPSFGDNPSLSR